MKIKCPVVEDLLPLYIDGVCSEESKIIVDEHLKECKKCSAKLKDLKGEILVNDDVIKENLKSKEPFKKIKKSQIKKMIVILISIPLLFLFLIEIRGDGVGFSALYGRYKAERFLSYIEKDQFVSAAKYMSFAGGRYKTMENRDQAQLAWLTSMKELRDDGIEIVSHRQNRIITDDRFTSGYVVISVRYKDNIYDFKLFISTNTGRVEPGHITHNIGYELQEPTEVERMLEEKISKVISTYNPG